MSEVIASTYRGHAIEPLVYPHFQPRRTGRSASRRYLAAVTITNLESRATQMAKIPEDFECFGDARRAAEARGRALVDNPEVEPYAIAATHVPVDAPSPFEQPAA